MNKYIRNAFAIIYFFVVSSICVSIFHESLHAVTTHTVRGYDWIYIQTAAMTFSIFTIVGALRVLLIQNKQKPLLIDTIGSVSLSISIALGMFIPAIFILSMVSMPVFSAGRTLGIVGYHVANGVFALIGAYFAPLLGLRQWKTNKNQLDERLGSERLV
jgi:hypothetical protein